MLNKILADQIQQNIKRIIPHGQLRFILGMQYGSIPTKSTWYATLTKRMIKITQLSQQIQKNSFTKLASIYNKNFNKLGKEGMYLNRIKAIYDRPTANNILDSDELKSFPLTSVTSQGCSLLSLFFNIVLEILAT